MLSAKLGVYLGQYVSLWMSYQIRCCPKRVLRMVTTKINTWKKILVNRKRKHAVHLKNVFWRFVGVD